MDLKLNERSHPPFFCRVMVGVQDLIRAILEIQNGEEEAETKVCGEWHCGDESPPQRGAETSSVSFMNCAQKTAQTSDSKRDKTLPKGDDLKKCYYDCDPIFQTRLVMSKRNTG